MSVLNNSTVCNFQYKSDERHDFKDCETYLQLDSDGVHFGVFYGKQCIQFASYQFYSHIPPTTRHEIAVKYFSAAMDKFKKLVFLCQPEKFLFIPDALWKKDTLIHDFMVVNDYFPEKETLHKKVFQSHKCTFIYTLPIEYKNNFKYLEQDIDIKPTAIELIAYYDKYLKNKNNEGDVLLHIQTNNLEIACFTKGSWIHYNQFRYDTAEDMLYYVLFTMEQLKLNTQNTYIHVTGRVEKVGNLYQLLYKYIRQIDTVPCPDIEYPDFLPNYHHFPLFFER